MARQKITKRVEALNTTTTSKDIKEYKYSIIFMEHSIQQQQNLFLIPIEHISR